jgi:hypothetical protein
LIKKKIANYRRRFSSHPAAFYYLLYREYSTRHFYLFFSPPGRITPNKNIFEAGLSMLFIKTSYHMDKVWLKLEIQDGRQETVSA